MIHLRLGSLVAVACMMDNQNGPIDHLHAIFVRKDKRSVSHYKVETEDDRKHALGALYYLESAPVAWADGQDMTEVSAVRRTIRSWRRKLGLKPGEKTPVPPEAE